MISALPLSLKGEVLMGFGKVWSPGGLEVWPVCLVSCPWAETGEGVLGNRCEIKGVYWFPRAAGQGTTNLGT